ncbi:RNA polymerase sigma factor, sigma-70 family [Chitinophaga jiangningensis]|uniref:RNA polymerase sigma factor, sigma-70 family n=1 Tax=Chitinophaga jiangningensis TaxID=1419482 RepID=A0A1M7KG06_9BACT|nr:sigma-70 family RNA polymerase sigma factor [Chitinophaga jiangningensis]SHM64254.1 RNA polymerase sigma factor, sigma-70 family [Chitinophaga jiangningensis]
MENIQVVNENTLWKSIIAGEQPAFKMLYEAYADLLFAYANRYTKDKEIILDCIHDLFIDLHTWHRNLAAEVNVRYYLLSSMRRKLHTALKKASRTSLRGDMMQFSVDFETESVQAVIIASEQEQQLYQQLAKQLNQLPARQKEIIYLKYHCDLSYEEIAAIMQISVPTCRTLTYRAVKQMRQALDASAATAFSIIIGQFFRHL